LVPRGGLSKTDFNRHGVPTTTEEEYMHSIRNGILRLSRLRTAAVALVALTAGTGAVVALAPSAAQAAPRPYTFKTLDDHADPTFNQLLGINNSNVISGYFGSGLTGHPNKGYVLSPPYGQADYTNENFPGSMQTQVTSLNNKGATAGFWVNALGTNLGFIESSGVFTSYADPHTPSGAGSVNQILGINDSGIAVGFYNNKKGNSVSYTLNQATGVFTMIPRQGVSTVATGINDAGAVVGFSKATDGTFSSFLLASGHVTRFQFPGGSDTMAFGINAKDQIVGSYLDGSDVMHGFLLNHPTGPKHPQWRSIDDPNGVGSTLVNGLNDAGDLVGFYTDSAGNTDGMLATP
jgi:probable HAF family extracellular repeat protein